MKTRPSQTCPTGNNNILYAVLTACTDEKVRIYDINTNGEPGAIFDNHNGRVYGLAQLDDDLVASFSDDGMLLTKLVSDIHQVGQWKHSKSLLLQDWTVSTSFLVIRMVVLPI